jgi:type IV pilus assembly protein PilY1
MATMFTIRSTAAQKAWAVVALVAAFAGPGAHAEDIDLFLGNPLAQQASAPNIMILLDNSSNWSREAQKWPGGEQGVAELQALQNILASPQNANIGLAMYTKVGNNLGGYIRFGVRDMTNTTAGAANRTALSNIMGLIKSKISDPIEKVNDSNGEAAALYEVYKYYKGLRPFRGTWTTSDTPNADARTNNGSSTGRTAYGQGLPDNFAIRDNGDYAGPPSSSCGRNYVIFIVNNAEGKIPQGSQSYEGVSAGTSLPVLSGVSDVSWTDEWARFLYSQGISVYIIDAFNAAQNKSHSAVLERAAMVGGGTYFPAKKQEDITLAVEKIKAQILATNTTFAAASLPISATNRSQNLNQVFIGMFRPDDEANPRWMGNLKQYKLADKVTGIDLVDRLGTNAVNADTGFVDECATSLWTNDSASYWENSRKNQLTASGCTVFPIMGGVKGSKWSDFPDGPTVEKGGVAEILRKGNNPPTTDTRTQPWGSTTRSILTYSSSATGKMIPLTASIAGWSSTLFSWVSGIDDPAKSEFTDTTSETGARTRPSIHGDVIHSRPLPVNYGAGGVTVYYGTNDGMLRAVDAATGRERWAYVAPEHYAAYQRLHDNNPPVKYSGLSPDSATPKDYFFDGSFGIYQNLDSSKVWIFPTMRRGGRMLYGFDVTTPDSPKIKWRVGCPNLTNDLDCTEGFEGIGQTWSLPSVAFLKGYSTSTPVIVVGGGYDKCEDVDSPTVTCDSRKGNSIYVLNADTGAVIKTFTPSGAGSFTADIALSDVDGDGSVDYGYAADTKGNIYRIDFSGTANAPLAYTSWALRKVGYTTGAGRKFLYPPSLLHVGTKMYVALGSGNRERPLITNYPYTTPVTNRFYVLLDDLTVLPSSLAAATNMDSDVMKNYTLPSSASCTEAGVVPDSVLKGWFMDLPGTGEQVVTSALIAAGMVAFNTNQPDASGNSCKSPLGIAKGYWVNLVNASGAIGVGNKSCGGDRSSVFVGGGLTPSPTLARVVVDGKTITVAIGAANRDGGPSVTIDPQQIKPTISSRRKTIYWKSNAAD